MFLKIVAEVGALAGFAAAVSMIVNLLKVFKVVKDGTADKWVAGFNLAGIAALYIVRLFVPEWDVTIVDGVMGEIAIVGAYIFSFIVMLLGSKVTYLAVKGLPAIGKSHSE